MYNNNLEFQNEIPYSPLQEDYIFQKPEITSNHFVSRKTSYITTKKSPRRRHVESLKQHANL